MRASQLITSSRRKWTGGHSHFQILSPTLKSWLGHTRKALNKQFIERGDWCVVDTLSLLCTATCNFSSLLNEAALNCSGTQNMHTGITSTDAGAVETPGVVSTVGEAK